MKTLEKIGCVVIGVMALSYFHDWKGSQEVKTLPLYKTTVAELNSKYDANEVAAQREVDGHRIEVTGTIQDFDLSLSDSPVVYLKGNGMFDEMHIEAASAEDVAKMHKGQQVTFIGVNAHKTMGSVFIESAVVATPELEKASEEPAPAPAEEKKEEAAPAENPTLTVNLDCKTIAKDAMAKAGGVASFEAVNAACGDGAKWMAQNWPKDPQLAGNYSSYSEIMAFNNGAFVVKNKLDEYKKTHFGK